MLEKLSKNKVNIFVVFIGFVLSITAVAGEDVRIATLNCYLLFSPALSHQGNVAKENRLSSDQYSEKIENLLSLVKGANFIALQETRGKAEIEELAKAGGYAWAFAKGRDTYTGEEVGALYSLPGWDVTVNGRVAELDKTISKHLLVTAKKGTQKIRFLIVHLIRPIGQNEAKHNIQIAAIRQWAESTFSAEPKSCVVILGDTNHATNQQGSSIFDIGREAGELLGFPATHLDGRNYDRLVLVGPGEWRDALINRPPYGKRPNDILKRTWTDHFVMGATLHED